MKFIGCLLTAFTIFLVTQHCTAQQDEFRTWKSKNGKFSLEAVYKSDDGETVVLETRDGQEKNVKIDLLSTEDQELIRGTKTKNRKDGPKQLDVSQSTSWNVVPDARSTKVLSADARFEVDATLSDKYMVVDPAGTKAILLTEVVDRSQNGQIMDLESGRIISDFTIGMGKVAAISPDLQKLAMVGGGNSFQDDIMDLVHENQLAFNESGYVPFILRSSTNYQIAIMAVKGGKIVKKGHWIPFPRGDGPNDGERITTVRFVDSRHLLISGWHGIVSLWDLETKKPIWWFQAKIASRPAVSANAKFLVSRTKANIVVHSLPTGELLGTIPFTERETGRLYISPSSNKLIHRSLNRICQFDLNSGKLIDSFNSIALIAGGSILGWINEQHLLTAGHTGFGVIDLRLGGLVWDYHVTGLRTPGIVDANGQLWFYSEGKAQDANRRKAMVTCVSLPHPELADWIDAQSDDVVKVIGRGDSVGLYVSATANDASDEDRQRYQEYVNEQFRRHGQNRNSSAHNLNMPLKRPARPPRGNRNSPSKIDRGPELHFNFPTVDVTGEVSRIAERKIAEAGYQIVDSSRIRFSVHMAPGNVLQEPSESTEVEAPHSVRFQFWLMEDGNRVWGGTRGYGVKKPYDTTRPEAVNYFEYVDLPMRINRSLKKGTTKLDFDGMKHEWYKYAEGIGQPSQTPNLPSKGIR